MKKRLTLEDVARAAGVSHTTVSWAIRNDPRICASTRLRVQEIAQALGYVPNEAARCLATGKTRTLALVSPSFSSAYEVETLRGIEAEMATRHPDFSVVQYITGGDPGRSEQVYRKLLGGNLADAVICLADPPAKDLRQAYREAQIPLVVFDDSLEDSLVIRGDSVGGTRLAMEVLLGRGCKRPLIVASREREDGRSACNPGRVESFLELCARNRLEGQVIRVQGFHYESGYALGEEIVDARGDGIFCAAGDMVAIGILAAFRHRGLRVPEDISLVGYDDLPVSAMVDPALSTIAQPLLQMGRRAVELAFGAMQDHVLDRIEIFPAHLVRRNSA